MESKYCKNAVMMISVLMACILFSACGHVISDSTREIGQYQNLQNGIDEKTFSIIIIGKGIEPESGTPLQKKLMADRAAVVDAYRNVSERIAGLVVDSYTKQGKFTVSEDYILSETNSYLRGARVEGVSNINGISTATVEILVPKELLD